MAICYRMPPEDLMPNLKRVYSYLLYSASQNDEEVKKRKPLAANMDGLEELGLSEQAGEILRFMADASNDAKCWIAVDLECPFWSGAAAARFELRDRGLAFDCRHHGSTYFHLTELCQRLLAPEPGAEAATPLLPVTASLESPASLAK